MYVKFLAAEKYLQIYVCGYKCMYVSRSRHTQECMAAHNYVPPITFISLKTNQQ